MPVKFEQASGCSVLSYFPYATTRALLANASKSDKSETSRNWPARKPRRVGDQCDFSRTIWEPIALNRKKAFKPVKRADLESGGRKAVAAQLPAT
jgi:hypothetical protein